MPAYQPYSRKKKRYLPYAGVGDFSISSTEGGNQFGGIIGEEFILLESDPNAVVLVESDSTILKQE